MKKVTVITGSPRKNGNSNLVAERFAAHLAGHGIGSEILQIGSMDIKGCKGCWACAEKPKSSSAATTKIRLSFIFYIF